MANNSFNDEAEAYLQHTLMKDTQSYLERGRSLKERSDDDLVDVWVAAVERWYRDRSKAIQRDMDDAAAEIRLRDLEAPEDRIAALFEDMKAEITRDSGALSKKAKQGVREFVAERAKPKN
jgi:hypothetical protein